MHHNDLARPTIGSCPCLFNPQTGVFYTTIIPALMTSLRADGTYDLWGFLPATMGGSSPKTCKCQSLGEVASALAEWFEDPEGFAMARMGWTPPELLTAKTKPVPAGGGGIKEISLDDIDFG